MRDHGSVKNNITSWSLPVLLSLFLFLNVSGQRQIEIEVSCETGDVKTDTRSNGEQPLPRWLSFGRNPEVIRLSKPGYRTKTHVIQGTRALAKSGVRLPALEKLPDFQEVGMSVQIGDVWLNLRNEGMIFERFSSWGDMDINLNGEQKWRFDGDYSEELVSLESHADELLNEMRLSPSDTAFFSNAGIELKLSAAITQMRLSAHPAEWRARARMLMSVDWTVEDNYGIPLAVISVSSLSNVLNIPDPTRSILYYDNPGSFIEHATISLLRDAFESSLIDVIRHEDFKSVVRNRLLELNDTTRFGRIELNRPVTLLNRLNSMIKTVCTVSTLNGHGSGCLISEDGYVVTNYHVAGDPKDTLRVILHDGREFPATLIRCDPLVDLALLKIEEMNLPAAIPTIDYRSKVGERVYTIGTPADPSLGQTISSGLISGIRTANNRRYIQVDAHVNPGNSGGGLFTQGGELIGIVGSKAAGIAIEGIGFAIPTDYIFERLGLIYK